MESEKTSRTDGIDRGSGFSFQCGRCSECCSGKRIQVNPFEISRIAANLKIGTTELIRRFTENGVYLCRKDDGRCVFLESDGCRVHEDRPLVCRLYPLGRYFAVGGEESFSFIDLPLQCRGIGSSSQTVEEYLESQDARVFIEAAEYYRTLLRKLVARFQQDTEAPLPQWISVSPGSDLEVPFPELLDPDRVIDSLYDGEKPAGLTSWGKMELHVALVEKLAGLNNNNR